MRLIDADALKDEKFYSHERHEKCVSVYAIDMMPTIEPRPHGEWKYNQYDGNLNIGNWHCSECRHIVFGGYSQKPYYNYCPNCGADMRKRGEEK